MIVLLMSVAGCAPAIQRSGEHAAMYELWGEPGPERRNLWDGPGGAGGARPERDAVQQGRGRPPGGARFRPADLPFDDRGGRLDGIRAEHVRWIVGGVLRLTDRQLRNAFAPGGLPDARTTRDITRLREKARQGRALP